MTITCISESKAEIYHKSLVAAVRCFNTRAGSGDARVDAIDRGHVEGIIAVLKLIESIPICEPIAASKQKAVRRLRTRK
jgi:molybdenum cofactor biosynthesis enzyme